MKCLLAGLVLAAVAGGCSIDHIEVEVDDRVPAGQLPLEPGRTHYRVVLSRLGPPAAVEPTGGGFLFRYETFRTSEWSLSARYRQGKVAYSFGDADFGSLVVGFDRDGLVRGWSRASGPMDLGWGGIVGHSLSPELFLEARDYTPLSPAHRWGRSLDEPGGG